MPQTVLVTGITGFAGSHLAERLVADGDRVHGFAFEPPPHPYLSAIADRVSIHSGDITDVGAVQRAIADARPDVVIHLAGQAVPTVAAADALGTIRINVFGTAAVAAAVSEHPGLALVAASSADIYGAPGKAPITEDAPLHLGNVYAASKAAAEPLLVQLGEQGANPVTILRPTNQNGPRQHPGLAASGFARQIAMAEAGQAEPVIRHGSLDDERDFLDVRDMARAYALAARLRDTGAHVYNVGSGQAVALAQVVRVLVGLASIPIRTELDRARVRDGAAATTRVLDSSRFHARTGWSPSISLERSLADLLDWWRSQIPSGGNGGVRQVREESTAQGRSNRA